MVTHLKKPVTRLIESVDLVVTVCENQVRIRGKGCRKEISLDWKDLTKAAFEKSGEYSLSGSQWNDTVRALKRVSRLKKVRKPRRNQ